LVDIVNSTTGNNPSQDGGPGVQSGSIMGQPVNGTVTPPIADTPANAAPAVDPNDPVAVAKAAYDAALAAAGKAPEAPPEPKAPTNGQPKVDVVPSATDDAGAVVYDPTGDAGIDMALGFIGKLGIPGTDPAMVAAANGDFTFIKAKLATMGDNAKGWEQHVALAEQGWDRQAKAWDAEQGKTLSAVHAVAGGKDQWDALVAWAGTQVSADEKAALDAMFDAGPTSAAMAARMLKSAYAEAKGTTVQPENPARQASGVAPAAPAALTAANYHKEADALYRQLGNRMDGSPEYAALRTKYFGR
jgi:hypothetical protein